MRIHSSFRDYYDFVANIYGGGDPKIVYVRKRLAELDRRFGGVSESSLKVEMDDFFRNIQSPEHRTYTEGVQDWMYLVIAGKPYLLTRESTSLEQGLSSFQIEASGKLREEQKGHPFWWNRRNRFGWEFGKEHPALIALSKKINAPVFVIEAIEHGWRGSKTVVTIAGPCPILQELGVPSVISAQQMYQDISMFVGNVLKDPVDTAPPVEVSNKEKILKAGFDLRSSFRHRV